MNKKKKDKKKKSKKEIKEGEEEEEEEDEEGKAIKAIEAEYLANKDKVIKMLVERIMDVKIEFPKNLKR